MEESLYTSLTNAVESSGLIIGLFAGFTWGVLSIILSPCHLASIPLIVGFVNGQGNISAKRAFSISFLFAIGILITIGAIGAVTVSIGRIAGDIGRYGNYIVALIFFLVGLNLLGIIPMPWSAPGNVGIKKKGLLAAFLLGLIFGIALGPCTFAFMAPVIGVAFKQADKSLFYGVLLLIAYGIGHFTVIVFAGTFTELVQGFMSWNERSKGSLILKKVCGVLVIVGGMYLLLSR